MTAPNTPAETSDQFNKPAKSGKLEVSDLITIGVFAALYFVMVCIATLVSTLFDGVHRHTGEHPVHQRLRLHLPARRTLDPRARLFLLLVANLMLFFHVGLATQIVMVVLFLLPLPAAAR